jgi:hypothetical protein
MHHSLEFDLQGPENDPEARAVSASASGFTT